MAETFAQQINDIGSPLQAEVHLVDMTGTSTFQGHDTSYAVVLRDDDEIISILGTRRAVQAEIEDLIGMRDELLNG
jgi:hypothetical protein